MTPSATPTSSKPGQAHGGGRPSWRQSLVFAALLVALVAAHVLLEGAVAPHDFMRALADAGRGHVGAAALAAVFLLVRLVVIVVLPGVTLAWLGLLVLRRLQRG